MTDKFSFIEKVDFDKNFAQLRQQSFMKDIALHIMGGIPSTLFTAYFFYHLSNFTQQATWVLSYTFICLACTGIYFLYKKKYELLQISQWDIVCFGIVILLAIHWSLPAFLLLNTDNYLYVIILLFQILTTCATPAAAIVYYPKAYVIFVSTPMLSFLAFLLLNHNHELYIYFIPLGCIIALLLYAFKLKKNVFHALNLQVENSLAWQSAEQANIAKSTFLASASHDIRQPLQAIRLLLEAFDEQRQPEKEKQLLHHLKSSVNGMSELLNSLLDVSRLDARVIKVEPEHIELRPLCAKLLQELEQQNQYKPISFHLHCDEITAYADPVILQRILNNLLSNALRYTEQGSITLSATKQKDNIIISIIDTGIGIKDNEKDVIFNEFYQCGEHSRQQQKGMGLGLSIVKRLCQLHNWKVSFTSTYSQGSVFNIIIKTGDTELINHDITLTPSTNLQNTPIVIIDDEPEILKGLKALLEKWGCIVNDYEDPDKAIIDISNNAITKPQLVISDYRLGNNKNGVDTINTIRSNTRSNIEAILMTGDTEVKQTNDPQQSNITVLHKPIKPAQLRKVIQLKVKHLSQNT